MEVFFGRGENGLFTPGAYAMNNNLDDRFYWAGYIEGALTMIGVILLVGGFAWLAG